MSYYDDGGISYDNTDLENGEEIDYDPPCTEERSRRRSEGMNSSDEEEEDYPPSYYGIEEEY